MKTCSVTDSSQNLQGIADEALIDPVVLINGSKLLIVQEYNAP